MKGSSGYRIERLTAQRRALAAGQELARKRHLMYGLVEADLSVPRGLLREHRERTGERLSFTAYVVTCVARALAEFPQLNALRRGRSLVFLDEVIVEVLVERNVGGQSAVSYLPIRHADTKTLRDIHREIREAQNSTPEAIAGQRWLDAIPPAVVPYLMRWMSRSIPWALRLGVAGVNNVGMGAGAVGWALSPGAGTLAVTIGSIGPEPRLVDGHLTEREIGRLTITIDHDVVDGAPAARFTSRLLELLAAGESVTSATGPPVRP
ncbi:2-oxo acid dehydrogenase subunit E2 [Sinomonas sp. JGH33]|uniref:2-oxo acid dehydrogenase subunit E2 n=1 Tax=Sinomonas terricola TaxID=3110330 RepID=A0ABU5T925_9MICC|nr:2-oxo acid dehydrogenase subunit E2 [Sinomonas sp. JGH33]MEA5455951.1 2-oxo acid dehydrogenase subunit E2 [Sinomonas sp. JGH33]